MYFVKMSFQHMVYKKLSYRSGTARRAMLVNPCYMFHEMWVRKASNSNSDL